MISLTLSLMSLIALSVAQNHTVSLIIPNADPQDLVGSIVGGDATATTYVIQCADPGSNGAAATTAAFATAAATSLGAAASATADFDNGSDECGLPTPITLVEGPSTVAYSLALDDSTISINCQLSGTSVAVCTALATGAVLTQETLVPTSTVTTLSGTDVPYQAVIITAGSVTNTASTPTSTGASTTSNGGSTSPTGAAKGDSTSSTSGTETQTGSTTGASTKASGAAGHMSPAIAMGAAGAVAAVAAVVL